MISKKKLCLILVLGIIGVWAAPVNIPSYMRGLHGQLWKFDKDVAFDMGIQLEADSIVRRRLADFDAEAEGEIYSLKLLFTSPEKYDLYFSLGQLNNFSYSGNILNKEVKFFLKDKLIYSIGISYAFDYQKLNLGFDLNYRSAANIGYKQINIADSVYKPDDFDDIVDAKWKEWQAAFILAHKLGYFLPYIGVRYSDVSLSAKATMASVEYNLDDSSGKTNFGLFLGCSLARKGNISFDIQGRFFDEKAFSAIFSYKF